MAIVAGLVGSFIGGLLISLLSGDGIDLRPSGHHRVAGRRHRRVGHLALVGQPQQADGGGPRREAVGRPPQVQPALRVTP